MTGVECEAAFFGSAPLRPVFSAYARLKLPVPTPRTGWSTAILSPLPTSPARSLVTAFRSRGRSAAGRAALVAALTLGAIAVHSLFYNAFFEDPTTWALMGLVAVALAAREQEQTA